jgi:hypothetical protein
MRVEVRRGIAIEAGDTIADAVHDATCASLDDVWVVVQANPQIVGTNAANCT